MKKILCAFSLLALLQFSATAQDNTKTPNARRAAQMKTEQMAKQLKLNDEQKKAVLEINMRKATMETKKDGQNPTEQQEDAVNKQLETRLRNVLTADQYKQYQEMEKAEKRKDERKANASSGAKE